MAKIKDKIKEKKEKTSFFTDFKAFITKGNVLDMAVGVVVGTAFNAIVTGLVKNVINPIIEWLTNGVAINELAIELDPAISAETALEKGIDEYAGIYITYGAWLQTIVDFFIIALSVFVAVRVIKNMERKFNAKQIAADEAKAAEEKAAADAKAAEEKAAADAKAAEEKAALDEFYANIREIRDSLKK